MLEFTIIGFTIGFLYLWYTSENSKKKRAQKKARKEYQKRKNKPIKISPEQQAIFDRVNALTPSGDPIEWQRNYKRERNLENIIAWKKLGIKRVWIRQLDNVTPCNAGKKHLGLYNINNLPVIPCKDCDSPNCLCWYDPIFEWDD